jgi:hypothetical protein
LAGFFYPFASRFTDPETRAAPVSSFFADTIHSTYSFYWRKSAFERKQQQLHVFGARWQNPREAEPFSG